MIEPTGLLRDAASMQFNLPIFGVIDATDEVAGGRRVLVESIAPPGCASCGVISSRVHARREQVVRDIPVAGPVRGVWAKPLGLRRGVVLAPHVLGKVRAVPGPGLLDGPTQGRPGRGGDRLCRFRA